MERPICYRFDEELMSQSPLNSVIDKLNQISVKDWLNSQLHIYALPVPNFSNKIYFHILYKVFTHEKIHHSVSTIFELSVRDKGDTEFIYEIATCIDDYELYDLEQVKKVAQKAVDDYIYGQLSQQQVTIVNEEKMDSGEKFYTVSFATLHETLVRIGVKKQIIKKPEVVFFTENNKETKPSFLFHQSGIPLREDDFIKIINGSPLPFKTEDIIELKVISK